MKYFSKAGNVKSRISRVNATLTKGLCLPHRRGKNCPREMINFSSDTYPWLSSRERFKKEMSPVDYSNGAGVYNQSTYYVNNGKFWYKGNGKFKVSQGKKQFYHYNGKILVFPDMIYYDPSTGENGKFGVTTDEITYCICQRTMCGVYFGLASIYSEEVNLTDYFKVGDGIKITDEEGLGISGFHTITGVNEEAGLLYFDKFEFGDGEGFYITGKLSHGAPETCDAVCICGGRVWIASGNKIYASTINDECNWAVGGDDEKSSFVCDFDSGETITACVEFEGSPVFFSEKKIYKVYGDRASNFYLKCCSNWGGIPKGFSGTIAVMKDKIYYMSEHGVTYFDGSTPRILDNSPLPVTNNAFGAAAGHKYYIFIPNGEKLLYVYDEKNGLWHKHGGYELTAFLKCQGGLYACTETEMLSLYGESDLFTSDEFEDELYRFVEFSLDIGGGSPLNFIMSYESDHTAEYEVYISYDSEDERRLVKYMVGEYSERLEVPLVPRKCENLTVGIGGVGMIKIKELGVDVIN